MGLWSGPDSQQSAREHHLDNMACHAGKPLEWDTANLKQLVHPPMSRMNPLWATGAE